MLAQAKTAGIEAALRQYGVKEAGWLDATGRWLGGAARNVGRQMIGHPEQLFQGTRAFKPGGAFSAKNVFWPTVNTPAGASAKERLKGQAGQWLGRTFGTILPAYGIYQAIKNPDPSKGTLTNALGSIGGAVGAAYGFPMAGMLGGGLVSDVGRRVGEGVGNFLGSKPDPHDMYPGQLS